MDKPWVWVAVFIKRGNQILIWRRKSSTWNNTWCIPWGKLELWESFEECVQRETLEEAGISIKNIELLWPSNDIFDGKHYVTLFMVAEHSDWEAVLTDFDEFYEWKWLPLEWLPTNLFYPLQNFLDKNVELIKARV